MNFEKYKTPMLIVTGILLIILIGLFVWFYFFSDELKGIKSDSQISKGFELDTLFLKLAVKENITAISHIKIKNLDDNIESCEININQIGELFDLNKTKIDLEIGEEQDIELVFNSSKEAGIYTGKIIFDSPCKTQEVPIILEIQSHVVVFDSEINFYPLGKDIFVGNKINSNIKIFDLANIGQHEINVEYFIRGFDNKIFLSEKENLIVYKKLEYSKTLNLQENVGAGNYVLGIVVKYVDIIGTQSIGTSSAFFSVVEKDEGEFILSDKLLLIMILIFGTLFLILLVLLIYVIFFRNKIIKNINIHYNKELGRQIRLIINQEKQDSPKLQGPEEKQVYQTELNRIKRLRIGALEQGRVKKIKEFKQIKKKYKGKNLKKQLESWKKQGYDTRILDEKYKIPSIKNIQKKVKQYKKQGYTMGKVEKKNTKIPFFKNMKRKIAQWRRQGYNTKILNKNKDLKNL
tara:strand:+ start:1973 stop:3358 length:1386 start_codon:yes stop_codon:yes gene_type:complete